jgi:hypothetical protein
MAHRIDLSGEDCQRIAAVVRALEMAQSAVATASGVKQPWLSYLLRGSRRTSVDAGMVEKVALHLAKQVRQRIEEKAFTGDWTEERARLDLSFLSRFSEESPQFVPSNIHQPGGPIASNAIPYVERAFDSDILETLRQPSFALLARGPVQSGKSTLLALLERRAREIGIETAWFDPQPPSIGVPTNARYDADAEADSTLAVSELLQARWGLNGPRRGAITTIAKLNTWLLQELTPAAPRPRLLILDDLVTLGGAAAERWLSLFVRPMVNQRATRGINISIAVGMTEHFGAYFARKLILISSVVHWRPRLTIGWLTLEEVAALLNSLREKDATDMYHETAAPELYTMFRGQPYLTHAAAVNREFRGAVQQWVVSRSAASAAAVRQFDWYRRHLNAIRLALFGPTYEPNGEARELIQSFSDACTHMGAARPDIDNDHALFLQHAQLLDTHERPSLEIYRLFAEDLQRGTA